MKKAILQLTLVHTFLFSFLSCDQEKSPFGESFDDKAIQSDSLKLIQFYELHCITNPASESIGTVGLGQLKHGKIMPFYGSNYTYFSSESYYAKRAFTSDHVKAIILSGYAALGARHPNRQFYLMELSHEKGGKLYPHHTHQNGLSADFMMPKLKDGQPDYSLDTLGAMHYFLTFNNKGQYQENNSIQVDFQLMAEHIFILCEEAEKVGSGIEKVIIKLEYKDALFATPYGKKLMTKGIYFAQNLSKQVNDIHDDHFHIDFKKQ